jgi:hypothetical protein
VSVAPRASGAPVCDHCAMTQDVCACTARPLPLTNGADRRLRCREMAAAPPATTADGGELRLESHLALPPLSAEELRSAIASGGRDNGATNADGGGSGSASQQQWAQLQPIKPYPSSPVAAASPWLSLKASLPGAARRAWLAATGTQVRGSRMFASYRMKTKLTDSARPQCTQTAYCWL